MSTGRLAQLLGAETAASTDSFTVQAVLDHDSRPFVTSAYGPEAVQEWQRRRAEKLPYDLLRDLAEAVRILQFLEAHDPKRMNAIKKRFLDQLQSSSKEIERELAAHHANDTRDYRVKEVYTISGPDDTFYYARVDYMKFTIENPVLPLKIAEQNVYSRARMRWIPAKPLALFLLRLNWQDSRIYYDLPPVKKSGLERFLENLMTITEFVLLVTGIADVAVLTARLLGVLAGAGTRALGAGLVRSLALRREASEVAAGFAGRAEATGLRTLPELGRATGDTARLTTRAIRPAERGLPLRPSVLGDRLIAERGAAAAPVTIPSRAAAEGLADPEFVAARSALGQALGNPAVGIDELSSLGATRTRGAFRRRLVSQISSDPDHPLNFLLVDGRLRPSTAKGITELDWLETPEIIEAGHVQSAKALSGRGVQDRFMVMSAYENRLLSSTVEHPSLGGFIDAGWALEIKGVPVQAKTAIDWVAKGLLKPSDLAAARRVIYR